MPRPRSRLQLLTAPAIAVLFLGVLTGMSWFRGRPMPDTARAIPAPEVDPAAAGPGEETVVLAGGCFWGIQAVYEHVRGVTSAVSGYAGGTVANPSYEQVSSGETGHAESVRVTFDPAVISFGKILAVFFSVAHDPTELNRQGPDVGTNYRSAIFYSTEEQRQTAQAYIDQLTRTRVFRRPIVTQVQPLRVFYRAEEYHQDYATKHPDAPYIVFNDAPKVEHLRLRYPDLYRPAISVSGLSATSR